MHIHAHILRVRVGVRHLTSTSMYRTLMVIYDNLGRSHIFETDVGLCCIGSVCISAPIITICVEYAIAPGLKLNVHYVTIVLTENKLPLRTRTSSWQRKPVNIGID